MGAGACGDDGDVIVECVAGVRHGDVSLGVDGGQIPRVDGCADLVCDALDVEALHTGKAERLCDRERAVSPPKPSVPPVPS